MERHSQPPPDDFPRLWGVEDKLGLYIPKQKGVRALEGELDISPRRYLYAKQQGNKNLERHAFDNQPGFLWHGAMRIPAFLESNTSARKKGAGEYGG